jgi:pilus assembly protein CpaE
VPDTRVLLIGDASSEALARALGREHRAVTVIAGLEEAIAAAHDHDVIVVDKVAPPLTAAAACRDLRAAPALAERPVLAISAVDSVEERIRLLEAGADDVVAKPVDERELDARVEALVLRYRRSKELHPGVVVSPTRRPGRRLIAVFSPKGGVGSTTVAVNLGLVLAARQPDQVVVLDLGGGIGQVATHLDLTPRLTLGDLGRDSHGMDDAGAFTTYLARHGTGLRILAASPSPIGSTHALESVERILETALTAAPTVIVDAGSRLDDATMTILGLADDLVFVVTPEFAALKALRASLEHLGQAGAALPEPRIVLNDQFAHEMLTLQDIEGALGRPITVRIPYDALLYQRAVNEGRPVYQTAPKSVPSQRFELLARVLLGEDVPHESDLDSRRRRRGIFGRA